MTALGLTTRDRRAIRLGGAALLAGLCWVLVLAPYLRAVRETSDRLAAERDVLERERALLASTEQLRLAIDSGTARLMEAAPVLFGGANEAEASAALARYLQSGATASKALLARVEPGKSGDGGVGLVALPLRVQGETDLWGLLSLLHMLESGQKAVRIDELRIGDGRGRSLRTGEYESLSFGFTVTGYMFDAAPDTLATGVMEPGGGS